MSLDDKLKQLGWYLKAGFVEECGETSVERVVKAAIDEDLRRIGEPYVNAVVSRDKTEWKLKSNCVFQVQKISNASAPKANEESNSAPRLLLLHLTDGAQTLSALDLNQSKHLSLSTPPGTKLKLKAGTHKSLGSFFLLTPNNFEVVGGKVAPLIEKWEINKSLAKLSRGNWASAGDGAPPPWVPFGQRVNSATQGGGKFQSFNVAGSGAKESGKEDDFEQQRKANIEEISKSKLDHGRKVFGGGKSAMSCDDVRDAAGNRSSFTQREPGDRGGRRGGGGGRGRGRRGRGGREERDEDEHLVSSAPSKANTLFDFLQSKMSTVSVKESPEQPKAAAPAPAETRYSYNQPQRGLGGEGSRGSNWRPGDRCLALYWEDNRYYSATVHAVAENGATVVVRFTQFANHYEEVLTEHLKRESDFGRGGGESRGRGRGGSSGRGRVFVSQSFRGRR